MSLSILLTIGVSLTIVFHFMGVYANAKKTVWIAILLIWAGAISIATQEVKPKAYDEIKNMQGKYTDTDRLIKDAMPKISLYELINIKSSYLQHKPKK